MKTKIFLLLILSSSSIFSQEIICTTKIKTSISLRTLPKLISETVGKIEKNTLVDVLEFKNDYWRIKKNELIGWVKSDYIFKNEKMYIILNNSIVKKLIEKYGKEAATKIQNHQIWVGMSKEMLIDSKGYADSINKTEIKDAETTEQWIYNNTYIYLTNNKVTAIQRY